MNQKGGSSGGKEDMKTAKVIVRRAAAASGEGDGMGGIMKEGPGADGGGEAGGTDDEAGLRRSPIVASGASSPWQEGAE